MVKQVGKVVLTYLLISRTWGLPLKQRFISCIEGPRLVCSHIQYIHLMYHFQSLTDGHPTINPEIDAIHPTTFVARDKHNRVGYFFWLSHSPLRVEALKSLYNRFRLALVECVGRGRPGRDGIDCDLAPTEVLCKNPSHLLNSAFGGDVEQIVGCDGARSCEGSGEEHDTTALWDVRNSPLHVETAVLVKCIGGNHSTAQARVDDHGE